MDKIVGIANCAEPEFALGCYHGTFREEGIKKGSIAAILHVCLALVVVVSCAHALDLHIPGCKS